MLWHTACQTLSSRWVRSYLNLQLMTIFSSLAPCWPIFNLLFQSDDHLPRCAYPFKNRGKSPQNSVKYCLLHARAPPQSLNCHFGAFLPDRATTQPTAVGALNSARVRQLRFIASPTGDAVLLWTLAWARSSAAARRRCSFFTRIGPILDLVSNLQIKFTKISTRWIQLY